MNRSYQANHDLESYFLLRYMSSLDCQHFYSLAFNSIPMFFSFEHQQVPMRPIKLILFVRAY